MIYLMSSRNQDGWLVWRRAPHFIGASHIGRLALALGETDLKFYYPPGEEEISEEWLRREIATRAQIRKEYIQAGLADPYRGATL